MKKYRKIPALAGFAAAACLWFASPAVLKAEGAERIAERVYIGTIDVGGMTEEEASAAVDDYVKKAGDAVISLSVGDKSIDVQASELGVHFTNRNVIRQALDVGRSGNLIKRYKDKKDLEHGDKVLRMVLEVDRQAVASLLREKAEELNQEAVDNGLVRENGSFRFIEGEQGIEVNTATSVEVVRDFISDGWDGTPASVELAAEIVEPRGAKEELSKIEDVLGTYRTTYGDSGRNRCTNIEVAAGKINGTLLYPGEEFSVYETIGPLVASNGYELAGAYENGQTVESYGGGVCQISTTLYNAVILAELEITERSNHSMIVNYVKPSMDAAIAGDYKDLKFVNNKDIPVYIEASIEGKSVSFSIFGEETRPSNRKVAYESEVVSEQHPGTQFVATGDPAGYVGVSQGAHTGYVARLWKIVTVDGAEESREIFNKSTYRASPRIVRVGTASADPNISAAMGAAIASGDEATIRATAASCAAGVVPGANPEGEQVPQDQAVPPPEQPQSRPPEEQAVIGTGE